MRNLLRTVKGMVASLAILTCIGIAAANADDVKTVKVGITPYFDYMPWVIAKEKGLDKEVGINLDLVTITNTAAGVAAMRQGSLDIVSSCHVCNFPLYKSVPSLRSFLITDQFKGFIVIGRKGTDTFAELEAKVGAEKAKEQILKGFKGKTFPTVLSTYKPLLTAALDQVGMTISDLNVIESGDDAQAALAFQRGTGDFYVGSLPQETKLLSMPDKYVNVGGSEILGPAGLWYSTMVSTQEWLDKNDDTAVKLAAIWYRVSRYADERFDDVAPIWVKATNERAAASFTIDDFKGTFQLLAFPTLEKAKTTVFNPSSGVYWKKSVDFYEKQNADQLPGGLEPASNALEEKYYTKLAADKNLTDWINSPLK
ncbi:ABC transporter substrate-binding protein [Brucella anthropi]|uniref:ABC transporter substrate-binding protein n=1 Tax=Brucella anthropi TaxID=529 RepID=UPI0009B8AEF7|nr:ABC transporter substrate-binding protein [Brucella anthropi]